MVAEGVGARGEGGRRLPRRVVNLSAALRRRRGRYYFLLLLLLLHLLLPHSPSHPPLGLSTSLHALIVSAFLVLPVPLRGGTRCPPLPRSLSCSRSVLYRSFDPSLCLSLFTFLRMQSLMVICTVYKFTPFLSLPVREKGKSFRVPSIVLSRVFCLLDLSSSPHSRNPRSNHSCGSARQRFYSILIYSEY